MSAMSALHFRDTALWEDLGTVPCSIDIPSTAWLYAAVSDLIDFAALDEDVWICMVIRVTGAAVGVSILSPDGSTILTEEQGVWPGQALRSVVMRVSPSTGEGLLLLRNYESDGLAGRTDIISLEFVPASHPKGVLLAAITPIFNAEWYAAQHPELDTSRHDALSHYLDIGAAAGADPNPFFETRWYVQTYPDALDHPMTPIEHYLRIGAALDYDPSPRFSSRWYRDQDPKLADPAVNPLEHFLKWGRLLTRVPNPYEDHFQLQDLSEEAEVADPEGWFGRQHPGFAGEAGPSVALPLNEAHAYAIAHGELIYGPPAPAGPDDGPPPYVARFDDVIIQGGTGLIVTAAGEALHDEMWYSARFCPSDTKSAALARMADGRLLVRAPDRGAPGLAAGIHLMNEADANYFHWVAEVLPRLWLMQQSGVLADLPPDMPLLMTEGLDPRLLEMFGYLATEARPVALLKRDHLYRIDRVIYPGSLTRVLNNYYLSPNPRNTSLPVDVLRPMAEAIKARVGLGPRPQGRRVYLHRGGLARILLNQPELEAALTERGFEILDPAGLSAREQIRQFAQFEHVIAPTGAALTNILWCSPGTRITVLYPDHEATNPGIWDGLAAAAGCRTDHIHCPRAYKLVGRFGVHDNYSFPMEWLPRLL